MRWSHFFLPTSTFLATAKLFSLFLPVAHKCYHYSVVSPSSLASQSVCRILWKPVLPSCLTGCVLLWVHVSVCTLSPWPQSSLNSLGSPFFLKVCTCNAFQQHTCLWLEPDPSVCRSYPFRNCEDSSLRLIKVLEWAWDALEMLRFVYWGI